MECVGGLVGGLDGGLDGGSDLAGGSGDGHVEL